MKKGKKKSGDATGSVEVPDESARRAGNILRRVVRDQIRSKKPAIVEETYRRLLRSGEDEKNAIELIAAVLVADMYDMVHEQREFDESKYAAALKRLPELPE